MNLEERLYTSTEVAQILGVSLRSVYRYLEEGKLDAEVKTATGRHRFTKQNILDFLYPNKNNSNSNIQTPQTSSVSTPRTAKVEVLEETEMTVTEKVSEPEINPASTVEESIDDESSDTEPVDWLAKFREAASKFKTEDDTTLQDDANNETLTDLGDFSFNQAPETEPEPEVKSVYYRSMLGGLKDIAQNIDKSARKAGVDYAFTQNAGLSLHKPIRPFSMLHAYIRPQDRELFEKMLQLVPSEKDTAQVCLLLSNKENIYNSKKELHGLNVVSDAQLKTDLLEAGETELARELDNDFPF